MQATGGAYGQSNQNGGSGGNGTVTVKEVGSVFNYKDKEIVLSKDSTYQINIANLSYRNINTAQSSALTPRRHCL